MLFRPQIGPLFWLQVAAALAFGGARAVSACTVPPPVDPLHATRSGIDVALHWATDPSALGYEIRRVDDKSKLPGILLEPLLRYVGGPAPVLPVIDGGAVPAVPALGFYQVHARCVCPAGQDRDGDRLDDCVETATGVFIGPGDTGTDPDNADTDGDAISDGDEVLGTLAGLDLPALGANPLRLDVFNEYDWFDDNIDCGNHSHRPLAAMVDRVTQAFADAPVANPDGSTGIAFHHDYGQGAPFDGGNFIDDADGVLVGGVGSSEFKDYKLANFDPRRGGYFHYTLLPHRYNTNSGSSGQAEINGDDLIVSLYCSFTTRNVANTIVHEIGHNFDLLHGGQDGCNYKPNYDSVMNYKYQFPGADTDCDAVGDGLPDYSRGMQIDLDENNLDENAGICGGPAIDWDGDSVLETGVVRDLNNGNNGSCGGTLSVIRTYSDWSMMVYSGILDSDFALRPITIIDCDNPAPAPAADNH